MRANRWALSVAVAGTLALLAADASAAAKDGFKTGDPEIQSAGPLAFGPDGVLFIGDPLGAAIVAIDTADQSGSKSAVNVDNIGAKVAAALGTDEREVLIQDLAVNPLSGQVYLSVSRGRGPTAKPVLLRVNDKGDLSEVPLDNVSYSRAELPNAPDPEAKDRRNNRLRTMSITDLEYLDGRVFVAGLSNEDFNSTLRSIPFPFDEASRGAGIRIFHGAHGRFETDSPVRTFTTYNVGGEPSLLCAHTCTPLVKFPVSALKPGAKVNGITIAELGNRNRPLDMVVYQKGGKDYILLANSSRGVMKISTENIEDIKGIEEKINGTAGLKYETIPELQGVEQLDRLDDAHAVILVKAEDGKQSLKTIDMP